MKSQIPPKQRILETAYQLFYSQGYHATGINQILEESDVAKASLYLHYGSKEDLGLAYIQKVREDWFAAFDQFIGKKDTPQQKILASFDFLEMNMKLNEFRGCRFLNLLTEVDNVHEAMQSEIQSHKSKLRSVFKTLLRLHSTEHGPLLIPQLHDTIYLLFEAAITESKVYRDSWPIATAKKSISILLQTTT